MLHCYFIGFVWNKIVSMFEISFVLPENKANLDERKIVLKRRRKRVDMGKSKAFGITMDNCVGIFQRNINLI